MYQALYRKWRPRTFADVAGQEHVTRTLKKQVAEGRTSHAYLFTGTRGTGKTTCAKILARAVNCQDPRDGDPCGVCPACVGLESGAFLDVLELDAASNNGVDQIRALRDEAVYAPANVRRRVYIVDEVHMLSVPAFNALLKILEEPPEHLMFILATTELHKVPATILSRCQRFAFKRILPQEIQSRLQYVADQEGIPLTEDGAELLARLADGALRDGLSLLDQCAAVGGTVDAAAVLDALGLAGNARTVRMLEHVLRRETGPALALLGELYQGGKDMGAVLGELSGLVRDLLLRRVAPKGGDALLTGTCDAATLDRLGRDIDTARLLYMASTLQKAGADLYASSNRRTDAELCLLRLCDETLSGGAEALSARVRRLEEALEQGTFVPVPDAPSAEKTGVRGSPPPTGSAERRGGPAVEPPWESPVPDDGPPPIGDEFAPPEASAPPWDDVSPDISNVPAASAAFTTPDAPKPSVSPAVDAPKPSIPPPAPPAAGPSAPAESGALSWPDLAARVRKRLPPMYGAFLGKCTGALEGDALVVRAPDSITLKRLDNDRVRGALLEETPGAARLVLREGAAPSQEENFRELLAFSGQYDAITIRGAEA